VPAVVSQGAPWRGLVENACGWWHAPGEPALAAALGEALQAAPAQLQEMGARGRAWIEREFSWGRLGRRMLATYEWVLGGGAPPDWVRVD
jgi:glycosyltransferase involved in cell wall biosynthesis